MPAYWARERSTSTFRTGRGRRLLDVRVGDAGDVADLARAVGLRIGEVRRQIVAADLQVDRRRRAEIQDLADDVGRQERERQAREAARQFLAQPLHVFGRRAVPFAERDLDVAVLRADRAGVVVDRVDARQVRADVVDDRRAVRSPE